MKTSHFTAKTRRQAFRFTCNNQNVLYKTDYEDGKAILSDISTSGCAIKQTSIPLVPKQKVLLAIEDEGLKEKLEIGGRVVRVDNGITAIQFSIIERETAKSIQLFFSKQHREMKRRQNEHTKQE